LDLFREYLVKTEEYLLLKIYLIIFLLAAFELHFCTKRCVRCGNESDHPFQGSPEGLTPLEIIPHTSCKLSISRNIAGNIGEIHGKYTG
jgi:hypothetical protein